MSDNAHAIYLSMDDFQSTLNNEEGLPVLVDFYAEWCGPCKMAAPIVDKLAGEYAGKAIVAKLDVDEYNELAQQYNVRSIPTVLLFGKKGDKVEELDRQIGFMGEDRYRGMLNKVVQAGAGQLPKAA